jgi:hypothetical protein
MTKLDNILYGVAVVFCLFMIVGKVLVLMFGS